MDSTLEMDTIFGDGSNKNQGSGLMGKIMGAGKRAIMGESLFMTLFTQRNNSEGFIMEKIQGSGMTFLHAGGLGNLLDGK